LKLCKNCRHKFEPKYNSLQLCCCPACAIEWAKSEQGRNHVEKQRRKETRERREALKTKSDYRKEAKVELHKWIRLVRDKDLPCISCGNPNPKMTKWGQWDAGHYRSVGSCPELEFEPLNIAKQCKRCNAGNRLSGNTVGFRNGIIERHGVEVAEWLDGRHPMTNHTEQDYIEIRDKYRKINRLARQAA